MLAFAGMTHLGIVSAVAAAARGFKVVAFDQDQELIQRLQFGNLPISEPNLLKLVEENRAHLTFTSHIDDIKTCPLIYVSKDVPTNSLGHSDMSPIEKLVSLLVSEIHPDTALVILSQVSPGFTRKIPWKKVFYQVETLIFGQAIDRALNPERFIVGCLDPEKELPKVLRNFLESFGCPILPMRYESAELAKIAINMFLVSSVCTTNMIASLCEKMGAQFSEIAPALMLDKRIGPHAYLKPGLGISGGNLERDLSSFCALSDKLGTDFELVTAWQKNSERQSEWVLRKIHEKVLPQIGEPKFALLGLSYKKDTASIKNSPALKLMSSLTPFTIFAFDPVVKNIPHIHPKTCFSSSESEACENGDVILVMTPWDQFKKLPKQIFEKKIVIDPFRVLELNSKAYFTLGA